MLVAAGIVFGFMGNPQNIFLNARWGLRQVMPPPPPHGTPWSDNCREGIATPSQSAGAVRGDSACPLRNIGALQSVENSGFLQSLEIFIL